MFNLILAVALTVTAAFPTPERVRADIAHADSLRAVHYQQLLSGEIKPDAATRETLSRIRGEIARDFETSAEAYGRNYIPMGTVDDLDTNISRAEFIETVLRKELSDSGWLLKEWNCELEASLDARVGWIFQWWIVPKAEE